MLGDWSEIEACSLSPIRAGQDLLLSEALPYTMGNPFPAYPLQRLAGEDRQQRLFTLEICSQGSANFTTSIKLKINRTFRSFFFFLPYRFNREHGLLRGEHSVFDP